MPGERDAGTLTRMRLLIAMLAVSGALVTAGCGGSSSDDAKSKAGNARADIQTQITKIQGLATGSTTLDEAKAALDQINKDLDTIANEAPKVAGDLGGQLTTANDTFKKSVQEAANSVTSAGSLSSAAAAVSAAAAQLSASYKSAFAGVKC